MKLKNSALQELYDTLVNCPISISPYAESPVSKAFRECDEKLQNDIDIWKRSNEILLSANDEWRDRAKHAEEEVEDLNKDKEWLTRSRLEWAKKFAERGSQIKELKETLEKANADRTELQKDRDSYHGLYTELIKTYNKLFEENKKLKARTDCHRYEVEWYRKHYKEQSDKIREMKKQLEELTSQYQKLTIENKRLQNNVRAGYDQGQTDLWVKLQNVNNSQPFEIATCFPDVTGMEDILNWDLEDFLDAYKKWQEEKEKERLDHMRDYLARFCEGRVCEACPLGSNEYKCGCGYSFKKATDHDVRIIPDEELEKYYEKARGGGQCTLKDGKLFIHDISHPMAGVNEAIKNACERFTKAVEAANINISTSAWHGDATAEKIKIEPWSCTLEGTINVEFDRDLLEKVCGVKPEEKKSKPGELVITTRGVTTANYSEATMNAIKEAVRKFEKSLPALDSWESTITGSIKVDDILEKANDTEHKLEYGDAVRVLWRDYDYMYIGPDKRGDSKMIRLFDPKHHSVAYVSSNEHLDIRGYKIIIGNEEDLWKIWCDKE